MALDPPGFLFRAEDLPVEAGSEDLYWYWESASNRDSFSFFISAAADEQRHLFTSHMSPAKITRFYNLSHN